MCKCIMPDLSGNASKRPQIQYKSKMQAPSQQLNSKW